MVLCKALISNYLQRLLENIGFNKKNYIIWIIAPRGVGGGCYLTLRPTYSLARQFLAVVKAAKTTCSHELWARAAAGLVPLSHALLHLLGSFAPWLFGSLAPWLLVSLAPLLLCSLAPWLLGCLGPWLLGSLAAGVLGWFAAARLVPLSLATFADLLGPYHTKLGCVNCEGHLCLVWIWVWKSCVQDTTMPLKVCK